MFRVLLILGFITAATLSIVHAQEALPTPLRAEDIFVSDNATVVETLPLWRIEDTALHLYDETANEWHTYVLPVTPDSTASLVREDDGSYTATLCHPSVYTPYYGTNNCTWRLDPTTGTFTLVELVCGGLTGQGDWVTYVNPETGQSHFCNVRTGELSAPLPVDFDVLSMTDRPFSVFNVPMSTGGNPSGNLVVITVFGQLETFDLVTGATIPLRPIEGTLTLNGGVAWVDDTHIVFITVQGEFTSPYRYNLYMADVTQDNSAQLIRSGEALQLPSLYYNTTAYEWLESDCNFYRMPFDTLEIQSYTIPGVCSYGVPIDDGSGDWLVVQDHQVLRYNREARSVRMLYMDGIGCYDALPSPGGRYQNLMFSVTNPCDQLAVLDLQSGNIVYLVPYTYEDGRERWVDSDTLLFYEMTDHADYLVHPSTGEEISLPHVLSESGGLYDPFSDDGRWIVTQPDADSLAVYDVIGDQTVSIAQGLSGYSVSARWEDDGTLHVRVEQADGIPVADWRVSIAAS